MKTNFTFIIVTTKSGSLHEFYNGYFVTGEDRIFIDAEYRNGERKSFIVFISEVESIEWYYKTDTIERGDKDEKTRG